MLSQFVKAQEQYVLKNVFFDFGKATIYAGSNTTLDQLASFLIKNKATVIEIGVHGYASINLSLTESRAQNIRNYLIGKGVNQKQVSAKGFGSNVPLDNYVESNANIRTEITFITNEADIKILDFLITKEKYIENISDPQIVAINSTSEINSDDGDENFGLIESSGEIVKHYLKDNNEIRLMGNSVSFANYKSWDYFISTADLEAMRRYYSQNNNIYSEFIIDIPDETLYWANLKDIAYTGSIKRTMEFTNSGFTVKNRFNHGTFYLYDGKIEGYWNGWRLMKDSLATITDKDGHRITGYFTNHYDLKNEIEGGVFHTHCMYYDKWIYLGSTYETAQNNYNIILQNKITDALEAQNRFKENLNEYYSFIENNYQTIQTRIKTETLDSDYGKYKRYSFKFDDGVIGRLDYYPERGEWCTFDLFGDDKCFTNKGKALCELYWIKSRR